MMPSQGLNVLLMALYINNMDINMILIENIDVISRDRISSGDQALLFSF